MTRSTTGELAAFTDPAVVDAAVADLIARRPGRIWKAADLVDRCEHSMLDTLMSLARLARSGTVERTGPGRYRGTGSTSNVPST